MNKILVGLIVGAVLGLIDGATAWFTPEVRSQMLGIIIGSTLKGIIAGIAAGWFARRVQSVPKGIAFGFIVGLLLAFAVAAMPDPQGNHYWWQIMVPGSILGGVIGWATQRYGQPVSARRSAAAALMLALALIGTNVSADPAHDHGKPATNAAFEKLKGLAGTWSANMLERDGELTTVEYRVTAGGSVVMETMFAGQPHEMINMYAVDGDSLIATHYCSGQNQPVLKLNAEKSTADELVFDFVKVSGENTKWYINALQLKFGKDGKVEEVWHTTEKSPFVKLFLNVKK
jgi:hypothetical protein